MRGDCRSFHTSACSRPPPPITRTFIRRGKTRLGSGENCVKPGWGRCIGPTKCSLPQLFSLLAVLRVIVRGVIPFRVTFRPGSSICEQVVYAAKKAIISRQLREGDAFPSVRVLSRELKINPNTAHKVVAQLITAGLLETRPGIGTVVSALPESTDTQRSQVLQNEVEELVVEAKKLGITFDEVSRSILEHWKGLDEAGSSRGGRKGR